MPSRAGGVLLHVRINGGRSLRLVLDSGAEFLVIGAKTARSLGLSAGPELEMVGLGTRLARVAVAERVEIGPLSFRNCPVTFVDSTVIEGADGVIPLSLFSGFLLRLNLPEKTLGLIPYPRELDPAVQLNQENTRHRLLLVETELNGKQSGYVILDTGAYCSAITREVAGTLGGSHFVPGVQLAAGTGAADGERVSSTIHFAIAKQDLVPSEVVALDLSNLSRHYGVEVMGVLGYPALINYVLTVDYRNGSVKIESPQGRCTRDPRRDQEVNALESLTFH